ncbi:hypothetical protein GCM10022240_09510 [Microbacterium kribbense]|uniref:DUF5666 domain-containing protein n=1 Tax=Microbacterium kribbense TaxID=433645 RepID=A0ABP7G8A7_9MICO
MRILSFPAGSLRRRPLRLIGAVAGGAATLLVLAACSGTASATTPTPSATSQAQQQGYAGGQARAGISGLIAAAQDGVLQLQSTSEQTAVRYTTSTTIRKTEKVAASAVKVGDCVFAITAKGAAVATSVTVTAAASDGTCTSGFGDRRGAGRATAAPSDGTGSATPRTRPSGAPTGAPRYGSGGAGGFGSIAGGKVTATTSSALTVQTTEQNGTTSTSTVKVDSTTTITATVTGSASDIIVGQCVTALGKADTTGGYDATALTLSAPNSSGTCTSGFGGGFGGRGFGGGGGSGSGSGTGQTGAGQTGGALYAHSAASDQGVVNG